MELLREFLAFIESSKYVLLFLGSFMEGTIVMMAGGFLWRIGQVNFWPMYLALLFADFVSDIWWYCFGYFGARRALLRWGKLIGATPEVIRKIENDFSRYDTRILAVSKLTMGLGFAIAVLATAGMLRTNLFRYMTISFLGGIAWVGAIVLIGYYFGNIYDALPEKYKLWFGILSFTAMAVVLWYLTKLIKRVYLTR